LSLTTSSSDKVGVVVYGMKGRLFESREVRPSAREEQQIGYHYTSGIYDHVLTQSQELKTLRVVKR
jgi:hypothetical protein